MDWAAVDLMTSRAPVAKVIAWMAAIWWCGVKSHHRAHISQSKPVHPLPSSDFIHIPALSQLHLKANVELWLWWLMISASCQILISHLATTCRGWDAVYVIIHRSLGERADTLTTDFKGITLKNGPCKSLGSENHSRVKRCNPPTRQRPWTRRQMCWKNASVFD